LDPTILLLLLLVEDEEAIQMLLEDALTEAHFGLVIAASGGQALVELDRDAARFRAVVTDVDLGQGPDGWEVARHARELVPEMPIVYMSGASGHDWAAKGVPKSVLVAKPFVPAQIITAVSNLLNEVDGQ
jgi:DNA-binding NtrC family response regulator